MFEISILQQIIVAVHWCIVSHRIWIMNTTMTNDFTTFNISRCMYKATIKDDIHDHEFEEVSPLFLSWKEVVKAV